MYRTCAVDGCDTSFERCEIHHPIEWQLQLDPSTRQLTITLPNGQHHSTCLPDLIEERAA